MSRAQALRQLSLDDFRSSMEGIYSGTLNESTIDETPMVYKPKEETMCVSSALSSGPAFFLS